MRSKIRLFALASAIAAFVALPLAAQNQGAHGGSGGGSHASSTSHSGNWAGGASKIAGPSHGGHDGGGGNAHHNDGGHGGHNNGYRRNNNYGYGSGYGYGYGTGWGMPTELPYDSEYDQIEGRGTFDHPQAPEQADTRVGPTIFEHNGQATNMIADNRNGVQNYLPQPSYEDAAPIASSLDDSPNPTILVFRDGHQQEVSNYAIAGTHLIILGNKTQKILLSDLDLDATSKANADRGIDFKMPPS